MTLPSDPIPEDGVIAPHNRERPDAPQVELARRGNDKRILQAAVLSIAITAGLYFGLQIWLRWCDWPNLMKSGRQFFYIAATALSLFTRFFPPLLGGFILAWICRSSASPRPGILKLTLISTALGIAILTCILGFQDLLKRPFDWPINPGPTFFGIAIGSALFWRQKSELPR